MDAIATELNRIRSTCEPDLVAVDQAIMQHLKSDVMLINQLAAYIISGGGKRLRILLTILAANACGYRGKDHITTAAIIEFIHTSTLLHDDVVDASPLRRGRETANALWGNEASVLVGDFLYSRSFQMMVSIRNMRVMEILAETTNTIAEGEVLQLLNCNDPDTTEEQYLQVIHHKTAKLFEAAAKLGAVLAQQPAAIEQALAAYGMHMGCAFQLIDDILDYQGDSAETGKAVGNDLAEGKPTLPVIYAMRTGNKTTRALLQEAIRDGGTERVDEIVQRIRESGAMEYTLQQAQKQAEAATAAIGALSVSVFKTAMEDLAKFAIERRF